METPYITRSQNPLPKEGEPQKPELFKPGSEQSKRSILMGISADMESNDPKDNLRALGTIQNMNILEIRGGKSQGLGKITAPIPGMEVERSLQTMIEDGLVKPSDSMKEMADRHGLEIPAQRPEGPNPFRPENSPEMLKAEAPGPELENPGIRDLTTNMANDIQGPNRDKAEAAIALDKAYASILNPIEKELGGLTQKQEDPKQEEESAMPWLKPKVDGPKEGKNPIDLFNDAAIKLGKLDPKDQADVMQNTFSKAAEKTAENSQIKSPLTDFLKNPAGALLELVLGPFPNHEKASPEEKEKKALTGRLEEAGVTKDNMLKDPKETIFKGMSLLAKEAGQTIDIKGSMKLFDLMQSHKDSQMGFMEMISKDLESLGKLLRPFFQALTGQKESQTPLQDREESAPQKKETVGSPNKAVDTLAKISPGAKGIKAGIDFFTEATSNKNLSDKMIGMTKAAGKAVLAMAQTTGGKMTIAAAVFPVFPPATILIVAAVAAKGATNMIASALLPLKEQAQEANQGQSQDKPQAADKKDVLEDAINTVMPNAGGKKGLAAKGIVKAGKTATTAVKDDLSGEKAQQEEKKQQSNSPDVAL